MKHETGPIYIFLQWLLYTYIQTSLAAQTAKNLLAIQETQVQSLGWEDPLEKEIATHSSTVAWEIPRTEETSSSLESLIVYGVTEAQTWLSN